MFYSFNMAHPFLIMLLVSPVFSVKSSKSEDHSITNTNSYNLTVTPSLLVGEKKIQLDEYLTSFRLKKLLEGLEKDYSHIVRSVEIGKSSISNRPIWAVQISQDVQERRKILKPMFKFVANIHADESVGYALLVSLLQYLVYSHGVDKEITRLLNTTDIWIVPTLNPDRLFLGEVLEYRQLNAPRSSLSGYGIDLDQDFPDMFREDNWPYQQETQSMLEFLQENPFVLSGNLQGGAVVASYPFDNDGDSRRLGNVSATSDNEIFVKLAKDYAHLNPMMKEGNACGPSFQDGIANGNSWNKKVGSMQDANYHLFNCFEVTFHLSCCKWASPYDLPLYWAANLPSMLKYIDSIHQGIYGLVKDREGNPIEGALVKVNGKDNYFKTTVDGEYWRLLVPGLYNVTVRAPPSFIQQTKSVLLTRNNPYVQLDFSLTRHSVYGTVVNKDNGKPAKDAFIKTIRVREEGDEYVGDVINIRVYDGKFGMSLSPGEYDMTVRAPGCTRESTTVVITEETPVSLHFQLHREGFFGNVTDQKGKIVIGAVILLDNSTRNTVIDSLESNYVEFPVDDSGDFWFTWDAGLYSIYAAAPGYEPQKREVDLNWIQPSVCKNFRIKENGFGFQGVMGVVRNKRGRPLKGAEVHIVGESQDIVLRTQGPQGSYERLLFEGDYKISASAPGYKTKTVKVNLSHRSRLEQIFNLRPTNKILSKFCF